MKKFILGLSLVVSASAFAAKNDIIFPQVSNYGSSVQVRVWNHTDQSVTCSGFIYMDTQNNQRYSEYYFDFVPARFTSYKPYYLRGSGDRIVWVNHSIFCN